MSDKRLFIGIDTSNYTTSVSACTYDGRIIANIKKLLSVDVGERGLRQSDALFQHTKNLPEVMEQLENVISHEYPDCKICAVGYSAYPRDCEGSYMPCFLAGQAAAYSMYAAAECRIFKFSHQAGHIAAALYSSEKEAEIITLADRCGNSFAAFHVSGGTTEILLVTFTQKGMSIEKIGGTKDINAGQAIDRAGVMLGLKFPCGREMEQLCSYNTTYQRKIKVCVNGLYCNLSGLENQATQLYSEYRDKGAVCEYVFDFVGQTLYKLTENLREVYPGIPVLYAGGVMSNGHIKGLLSNMDGVYFAKPEFSSDNAAGIALLCRRAYLKNT